MRRRWICLLGVVLLLSGCWSRVEVNDLGVVLGIAVDVGEEQPVRLTLLVARQGQSQQGQAKSIGGDPVWVVAREAENLTDAMREIVMASARRLSLHHVRVVLIGEEYARAGIRNLLDFLGRNPQIRLSVQPMVVWGRAQTVLETPPQLKGLQPENLVAMLEHKGGVRWRLRDLLVARVSDTHTAWAYAVEVIQRPAGTPESPTTAVTMSGAALFRRDNMVHRMSAKETQALSWLLGNPSRAVVTAPCPDSPDSSFSAQVHSGDAKVKPIVEGGRLRIEVTVSGAVDLFRLTCHDALVDTAWRKRLEQQLGADAAQRVRDAVERFQANRIDPVGVGARVLLGQPDWWRQNGKRWLEIWPETEVKVSCDITIRQSGLTFKPANLTDAELGEPTGE